MPRVHFPTDAGVVEANIHTGGNYSLLRHHYIINGQDYTIIDERNGEYYAVASNSSQAMPNNNTPAFQRRQEEQRQQQRQQNNEARIAAAQERISPGYPQRNPATSMLDQVRPLQDQHMRQMQELQNGMSELRISPPGIRTGPYVGHVYRAAVDPISCTADSSATYNVNGVAITALPNGDRDFAAELQAQSPHNAMTYRPSGFTMQDLDEMAARIQARARPDTAGNPEQVLARYGHLLTPADQQRLGYAAPAASNNISPLQLYKQRRKAEESVANFLTPPSGPTAQELAAADEWLKNSPWG